MNLTLALLIISLLLIYDFFFIRLLIKRRQREIFAIYIEQGKIMKTTGNAPEQLLVEIQQACQEYSPGLIKIYAIERKNSQKLIISGTIDPKFALQIKEKYQKISEPQN